MTQEAHLKFEAGLRTLDVERYRDEVHFEIDAPWYGDTESGFGATLTVTLPREQAMKLGQWILDQFKAPDSAPSTTFHSTKEKS